MHRSLFVLILLFHFVGQAQNEQNCNCCSQNHRAFDFWVGKWEVVNFQDGSLAGSSVINKEEGGCVIRENWTSAKAYTGTSLNFFNAQTSEWEQLWIDNAGASLKLKGNRVNNKMILTSDEFTKSDGKKYRNRIIWTKNDDGTVRQLWEVLGEGNSTSIVFDGLYRKVQKTKNR